MKLNIEKITEPMLVPFFGDNKLLEGVELKRPVQFILIREESKKIINQQFSQIHLN